MSKTVSRLRRARRARAKITELRKHRLTVHRTPRHIYAQVIAPSGEQVVASASTLDKDVRETIEGATGNVNAANAVGRTIAERAKAAGVEQVAFDRSGFRGWRQPRGRRRWQDGKRHSAV